MPQERLPMRKIRDCLRLTAEGLSQRQVALSLGVARATVGACTERARRAGLGWPLPEALTDDQLERRLYPASPQLPAQPRGQPDWAAVHKELKRKGVTLQLLWEEYRAQHQDGYAYSWYCELYREWAKRLSPTMRQTHTAGERMFVDYAGTKLAVRDAASGKDLTAELFVATLGASSYTYAEATWTQSLPDWTAAHARAYAFFGGVRVPMTISAPRTRRKLRKITGSAADSQHLLSWEPWPRSRCRTT